MNLEVKIDDKIAYIKPMIKSIDASVSTEFKSKFVDLINNGNNQFVLDFSGVDFVDSSGLGALISILKTLTMNNGKIVLCCVNASIKSLFTITRMDKVFSICDTQTTASELINNLNKSNE